MMSKDNTTVTGAGSVLRGNFVAKGANNHDLVADTGEMTDARRRTEAFEKAARERIGGSIAFVTKLRDGREDVLFWDGEKD